MSLVQGNLYRIGTRANATTNYATTYNNTFYGGFNGTGDPKYYPGIGNFTGGCYGSTCNICTIASTVYNIVSLNLSDPISPPIQNGENLTLENLTARIVYTQNFSTERVTKNLTFFSEFALIFRSLARSIWSSSAGILNIESSNLLALRSPTTNATGNLTIGQLVKLNSGALPACNTETNGVLAVNVTGKLMFCNGAKWQRVALKD